MPPRRPARGGVEIGDHFTGIELAPVELSGAGRPTMTLNAWDFGGQREYRSTHQIFFTAPALYLVVWKPRGTPSRASSSIGST